MAAPISTTYSPEERETIISHVLAELAGGRAVSRIMREDEGMPDRTTFWLWVLNDEELSNKVTRAREHGVEAIMDETVEIADDGTNDWRKRRKGEDGDEEEVLNHEHVSRSKLRVDTRHKYAQMIAPRKYGPKLDVTSDGKAISLSAEVEAARKRAEQGGE